MSNNFDKRNAYLVTSVFDWQELLPELQHEVMARTSRRVVEVFTTVRRVPENNPDIITLTEIMPELSSIWIPTIRNLEFKRPRVSIVKEGLLSVTFSDDADREYLSSNGLIPDITNIICAAMHFQQTWSNVAKIRLIPLPHDWPNSYSSFMFQFVIRDQNGERVANANHRFAPVERTVRKDAMVRRFVQDLKLTHAVVNNVQISDRIGVQRVVNGVDEFSV